MRAHSFVALHLHLCVPTSRGSSTVQPLSSSTPAFTHCWGEGLATLFKKTGNEHHPVELVLGKVWTEEVVLHLTAYCREGESSYGRGRCKHSLRASYMAIYKSLVCNTGESKKMIFRKGQEAFLYTLEWTCLYALPHIYVFLLCITKEFEKKIYSTTAAYAFLN